MITLIKSLILLSPLAWIIFLAPQPNKVLLLGAFFAFFNLARARALSRLAHAWPIFLAAGAYALLDLVIQEPEETYPFRLALLTTLYGLPAGFCLAHWHQGKERVAVTWAYVLFCLGLALLATFMVRVIGPDQIVRLSEGEVERTNEGAELEFFRVVHLSNVIIGIIPYTVFAMAALPVLLLPGWAKAKALMALAAALSLYVNLTVLTRTALVSVLISGACLVPLVWRELGKRKDQRFRFRWAAVAGLLLVVMLLVARGSFNFALLLDRFAETGRDSRFSLWAEAADLLLRNPLGHGIQQLSSHLWAHNLFLDFGLTTGWAGAAVMLALYSFVALQVLRSIRQGGISHEPLSLMLLGGLIAIFMVSLVHPPQYPFIIFTYLCAGYFIGRPAQQFHPTVAARDHPAEAFRETARPWHA